MTTYATATKERTTFIRVCQKPHVTSLVKEAKRVGYTITKRGGYAVQVNDPDNNGALVFKAVNVRPNVWAVSYALAYWAEEAPAAPLTPIQFGKLINTQPSPA